MSQSRVGFVGYRGMVGSVLQARLQECGDLAQFRPVFLSTSQPGQPGPLVDGTAVPLGDAYDIATLQALDIIVTSQGSAYTQKMHADLRASGWQGYWIDASSELRLADSAVLLLDPVNRAQIDSALQAGVKDLIGANCTVAPLLLGLAGLFQSDAVEWANPSSYQAASGAGAKNVIEMLQQMRSVGEASAEMLDNPATSLMEIDRHVSEHLRSADFPTEYFGHPIAGNILPWIDSEVGAGQSREEWKAAREANKILGTNEPIGIDGTCVRVSSMRSHAQSVTIKLKRSLELSEIEAMISGANEWVELVPNHREETLQRLTPVAVSGTLKIAVGRVRKLNLGEGGNKTDYLSAFVVGDQLLWGAAEPLRRALGIVLGYKF